MDDHVGQLDDWHAIDVPAVLKRLALDDPPRGLSDAEVTARRAQHGANALAQGNQRSVLAIIAGHIFNPLTTILMAVFIIAAANKEWIEAVVVILVIALNSSIGAVQEIQSENTMAAIRHLATAKSARVLRNGHMVDVDVNDLVLSDVVELRLGQKVPADLRLIETAHLEIDEAVLTGEAVPVVKTIALAVTLTNPVETQAVAIGDRTNMAFRQTDVAQGQGLGVVVAVGSHSQIGKIAARLGSDSAPGKTALTRVIDQLMYILFGTGILFAVLIFWAFEFDVTDSALLYASATLVAILPEAAIVLITVTMAIGARRMATQKAIVRKMSALEELGRVTDICSDKTGTLTMGKMQPSNLCIYVGGEQVLKSFRLSGPPMSRESDWTIDEHDLSDQIPLAEWYKREESKQRAFNKAILVCALCSSTRLRRASPKAGNHALEGTGNPTELALQQLAHKAAHQLPELESKLWDAYEPRGEWAFDSEVKRMTTGWRSHHSKTTITLTKGAIDCLLPQCMNINSETERAAILKAADLLASDGLRVLGLAWREDLDLGDGLISDLKREHVETNLIFVGLVAVRDPPKPESRGAVESCHCGGIIVRMLTGDHPATAAAIAREIGILPDRQDLPAHLTMTGPELDAMTDEQLDTLPSLPLLVARSSPSSKVKMVDALHRRNRVVAMTGDGVNDSPAIKAADVGIAMGIAGSDVTKGVADIVLADDNFATIVMAVAEGRRIFDSISHFVMHLLSGNMAEAVVLLLSLAFVTDRESLPVFVLSPLAILYLNTATGSGPAIGLAMDDKAPDLMTRPPIRTSIFTKELVADFLFYGTLMGGLVLVGFSVVFWGTQDGFPSVIAGEEAPDCNKSSGDYCYSILRARGTAFLMLNSTLLLHAYNCRHPRLSLFAFPLLKNRVIVGSVVVGTLVAVPILYVPWLNTRVFKHETQSYEWGIVFLGSILFMAGAEVYKAGKRRWCPTIHYSFGADGDIHIGGKSDTPRLHGVQGLRIETIVQSGQVLTISSV